MNSEAENRKFEAEAVAAEALAEFHAANGRRADAEARRADAEVGAFQEEARTRRAQADVAEIQALVMGRENALRLASDRENNVYRIGGAISDELVGAAMNHLSRWSRLNPGADLELQFYSLGGSMLAGLALWDFLQQIKLNGHKITTVINGVAASMAGILAQVGDHRVMGKESWLMIHEVSFGAQGKIGEIEDTTEWIKGVSKRVTDIFVSRSGNKLTPAKFQAMWKRKDAWISSDEALAKGLVDEVR